MILIGYSFAECSYPGENGPLRPLCNENKRRRASEHVIFITSRGDNNRVLLGYYQLAAKRKVGQLSGWNRRICSLSRPPFPFTPSRPFFPLFTLPHLTLSLDFSMQPPSLHLASATHCFLSRNAFVIWRTNLICVFTRLSSPFESRAVRCRGIFALSSASRYRAPRCLSENRSRTAKRGAGRKSLSTDIEEHRRDL